MRRVVRVSYSADAEALSGDHDLSLTGVAQVEPPRRLALLAGMRGEHDVAGAVAQVIEQDIACDAALPASHAEQQHRRRTDPRSHAAAARAKDRTMDPPEELHERRAPDGGHRTTYTD